MQYLLLLGVLLWSVPAHAVTADEDFAARCTAAGVVKCVGFDVSGDFTHGTYLGPDSDGNYQAGQDTVDKTSGAGSLVFIIPPPPHALANIAGGWGGLTAPLWSRKFKEHDSWNVQFRIKISAEMMNNTWDYQKAWKTFTMYMDTVPCFGGIGFATHNYPHGIPTHYTACGQNNLITNTATGNWTTTSDPQGYSYQQGQWASTCRYNHTSATWCWSWPANTWITFYYQFQVGTWDQSDSHIKVWFALPGDTSYTLLNDVPNMFMTCRTHPCDQAQGQSEGYNNIQVTPYMTGLGRDEGRADVTSKLWYDELIVSTAEIAVPVGTTVTPPPAIPRFRGGGGKGGGGGRTQ